MCDRFSKCIHLNVSISNFELVYVTDVLQMHKPHFLAWGFRLIVHMWCAPSPNTVWLHPESFNLSNLFKNFVSEICHNVNLEEQMKVCTLRYHIVLTLWRANEKAIHFYQYNLMWRDITLSQHFTLPLSQSYYFILMPSWILHKLDMRMDTAPYILVCWYIFNQVQKQQLKKYLK